MTLDDVFRIALKHFPLCHVGEDIEGGMMVDDNQELREMTDEDIA